MLLSNVTGFDSTAHLGDFLKMAGVAIVLFALMVAAVRIHAPGDEAADPAGDPPTAGPPRRKLLPGIVSGLGLMIAFGGALLYYPGGLKVQAAIVAVAGLVVYTTGRLLRPYSTRRRVCEAASMGILVVAFLLPGGFFMPMTVAAVALSLVGTRL